MNQIGVFKQIEEEVINLDVIQPLLEFAIDEEQLSNVELNVILIDNEAIRNLNEQHRGIDQPTDVLSFALEDVQDITYEGFRLLGDIYISYDRVREQALLYGHSEKRELAFLVIHGFLHLLGYDHQSAEEEAIMFKKQELILDGFKITR